MSYIIRASKRDNWVQPLIKRMRKCYRWLDRMQTLNYFADAPESVQLKIRRAEQLVLEALEEYEPHWQAQITRLQNDYLANTGDFNDPRSNDSPYQGLPRED